MKGSLYTQCRGVGVPGGLFRNTYPSRNVVQPIPPGMSSCKAQDNPDPDTCPSSDRVKGSLQRGWAWPGGCYGILTPLAMLSNPGCRAQAVVKHWIILILARPPFKHNEGFSIQGVWPGAGGCSVILTSLTMSSNPGHRA